MEYLSQHRWGHNGVEYEVNNFHFADAGAWSYEIYALGGNPDRNDYLEIRVPDLTPDGGPFTPAPVSEVVVLGHGEPKIPLPILRRVLDLMATYGHRVSD